MISVNTSAVGGVQTPQGLCGLCVGQTGGGGLPQAGARGRADVNALSADLLHFKSTSVCFSRLSSLRRNFPKAQGTSSWVITATT